MSNDARHSRRQNSPTRKGQGLVEYTLILVLAAVIIIVAVQAIGRTTDGSLTHTAASLPHDS